MIPKLQVALDNLSLKDALKSLKEYGNIIDVIEVGTILHVSEGLEPIRFLRILYPEKIILADIKGADAGSILAKQCFDAGATWMTAICCADIQTMKSMLKVSKEYEEDKDIQIELYGDWTFERAKIWKEAGLKQVVYHRSRDAELSGKDWSDEDLIKIKKLCDMDFKVTVTGGLKVENLKLFKNLPIYCFIAGRGIREAKNPKQMAMNFKEEIKKYWK
ncbi:3-keto-L-gulonate-6-phosphate decarboxylase UlaD [Oceanotoga teriensis]|jgi:3-keto-L-gulonate-6-phosphate decarboxylase|uniref:3-keto-L-gulonate-6-phosphate decarboxylase UlaD n=1 Tax=Oceanotoga teriensis TaxID=515440 RepID=UPI002712AD88|nr:3-keto-L-gulonate-6-phosphate decarboxylase UlaD [Oceanotoga teriensis]MDO7976453.1 3-keto-L-gulonate-6-phosphate decarboxylase UlaD [Oceanotoga teriensis]